MNCHTKYAVQKEYGGNIMSKKSKLRNRIMALIMCSAISLLSFMQVLGAEVSVQEQSHIGSILYCSEERIIELGEMCWICSIGTFIGTYNLTKYYDTSPCIHGYTTDNHTISINRYEYKCSYCGYLDYFNETITTTLVCS